MVRHVRAHFPLRIEPYDEIKKVFSFAAMIGLAVLSAVAFYGLSVYSPRHP